MTTSGHIADTHGLSPLELAGHALATQSKAAPVATTEPGGVDFVHRTGQGWLGR